MGSLVRAQEREPRSNDRFKKSRIFNAAFLLLYTMLLKNIISIIVPGSLAVVISFVLNAYTPLSFYNTGYGLLFFVAVCFILNGVYAFNARSKAFTELLMAGIVIKLLLSLIAIVIYSVVDYNGLRNFAIHFMIYYILFTIFEIRYLLYIIKTHQTKTDLV